MLKINVLFIIAFSVIFTIGITCTKDDTIYDVYFWTSIDPSSEQLTLFVDGTDLGRLPFMSSRPVCGNDSITPMLIYRQLRQDKYRIIARNNEGIDKSGNTLRIKRNGVSSSGMLGFNGGMGVSSNNECMIIEIFFE